MITKITHIIQRSPGQALGDFIGVLAIFILLLVALNLPTVL